MFVSRERIDAGVGRIPCEAPERKRQGERAWERGREGRGSSGAFGVTLHGPP